MYSVSKRITCKMITWSCTSFCLVSIHQHDCHSSVSRPAYKTTCMSIEGNMRRDKMREVRKKFQQHSKAIQSNLSSPAQLSQNKVTKI